MSFTMSAPCFIKFLSTPSVWRATRPFCPVCGALLISIHALRVEGDAAPYKVISFAPAFLSTPSVWRATRDCHRANLLMENFYPRPPCGGRQLAQVFCRACRRISIHALRVEGDFEVSGFYHDCDGFLSTPSVWRATCSCRSSSLWPNNFYPRPPCGGRHCLIRLLDWFGKISIHALRVEGDMAKNQVLHERLNFYPRPPCGGRHLHPARWQGWKNFYPRPPCGGRPFLLIVAPEGQTNFYPRPPCGGRRFHP